MQARADRFTYLPSLGVLVALVWTVGALVRLRPAVRSAAVAALLLAVVGFGGATRNALAWWRDDHALFERALAVTDRNWFIHANYGDTFFFEGRFDEAAAQYEQSLAIEPRTATTLARLGTIELRRGDADGAIGHFAAALRVNPDMNDAAASLASALESRGMSPDDAAAAVTSLRSSIDRSQADLGRPYGREYREGLMRALWQANTGVVMRCHDAVGAGPAFDLFLTVDPSGTVAETGSGPASPLGRCIAEGLVGARVPAPPFAPFHAWVTMRL
jgi:tetratricopeptide (TPR) repeat protein